MNWYSSHHGLTYFLKLTVRLTFFFLIGIYLLYRASLVAQTVKNLPAMQDTRIQSLGWEDTLEKEMATHSSILAWEMLWTEEAGRLQSVASQS